LLLLLLLLLFVDDVDSFSNFMIGDREREIEKQDFFDSHKKKRKKSEKKIDFSSTPNLDM
jgi:hypothetical protein